jgi:hypothetical protein
MQKGGCSYPSILRDADLIPMPQPSVLPNLPFDLPFKVPDEMLSTEMKAGICLKMDRILFTPAAPVDHAWLSVIYPDETGGHISMSSSGWVR